MDTAGPKVETLIVGWLEWNRGLLENVTTEEELKTLAGRMVNLCQLLTSSSLGLLLLLQHEARQNIALTYHVSIRANILKT